MIRSKDRELLLIYPREVRWLIIDDLWPELSNCAFHSCQRDWVSYRAVSTSAVSHLGTKVPGGVNDSVDQVSWHLSVWRLQEMKQSHLVEKELIVLPRDSVVLAEKKRFCERKEVV